MNSKKNIVIIGGGITGLAAAYRLSEIKKEKNLDYEITLLEASDRLGGIIETEERDGFLLENGPDSFISEKPWAVDLCKKLGIANEIIETQKSFRRSFIYKKGKLIPVPKGFYLITPTDSKTLWKTSLISPSCKLRMILEPLIPIKKDNEDESVASFITRRFGKEALRRLGQPMIGGIYTADPERLSLKATFPQFLEMEKEYGSLIRAFQKTKTERQASGPRYRLFLSLRQGLQQLVDILSERLEQEGIKFRLTAPVKAIEKDESWKIVLENTESFKADAICVALPTHAASHLFSRLSRNLSHELREIPYESVATVNIAFRREEVNHPLNGFGYVVPAIENRGVVGCTFSSVKFPNRAPQGRVLLRLFIGGAFGREMFELDDAGMEILVRDELRQTLGIEATPKFISIKRWPRSMPQYHLGHLERVRKIESEMEKLSGVYLAGNAYQGVGIPDSIKSGEEMAQAMNEYLSKQINKSVGAGPPGPNNGRGDLAPTNI